MRGEFDEKYAVRDKDGKLIWYRAVLQSFDESIYEDKPLVWKKEYKCKLLSKLFNIFL